MKIRSGLAYALLTTLTWAASIILIKFLIQSGEASLNILFWSMFLAFPYWTYLAYRNRHDFGTLEKRAWLILTGMVLISTITAKLFEFLALQYTSAINYSFLIRSSILFTIFFAWLFLKEALSLKKFILAAVLLLGMYFLTVRNGVLNFTRGDFFTLGEAVCLALGNNVLGRMASLRMKPTIAATGSFLLGAVPLLVLLFWIGQTALPRNPVLILLLTIILILTTHFRFRAYRFCSASYMAMFLSLTPVLATLLAILLLGEKISLIQALGGILIVSTGVLVEKFKV